MSQLETATDLAVGAKPRTAQRVVRSGHPEAASPQDWWGQMAMQVYCALQVEDRTVRLVTRKAYVLAGKPVGANPEPARLGSDNEVQYMGSFVYLDQAHLVMGGGRGYMGCKMQCAGQHLEVDSPFQLLEHGPS